MLSHTDFQLPLQFPLWNVTLLIHPFTNLFCTHAHEFYFLIVNFHQILVVYSPSLNSKQHFLFQHYSIIVFHFISSTVPSHNIFFLYFPVQPFLFSSYFFLNFLSKFSSTFLLSSSVIHRPVTPHMFSFSVFSLHEKALEYSSAFF